MYRHFAHVYDSFMKIAPYDKWAVYIDKVFKNNGVPYGSLVLDLACGTGTMAFLMAQKGYEIIGVDASEDMLSEAAQKKEIMVKGKDILFLNQDILNLDLYGTVNAAYSTCDALNYILTEEELEKVLFNVALFLETKGVFIFDLKTEARYRQMGSNTYYDNVNNKQSGEEASYIWKNHFDPITKINEYNVQFFLGGKKRESEIFSEVHRQRAYDVDFVKHITQKAGFLVEVVDNYTDNYARADSDRVTFICIKSPL